MISAILLTRGRKPVLADTLDRLERLPIDEVIVVDNGSDDGSADMVRSRNGRVRLIEPGANVGIAGRNLAAREAKGELLLMLDDDSYPLPGAVEALSAEFERQPRLGVAAGLVYDVELDGTRIDEKRTGSFDWFLRAGRKGDPPPEGFPVFFFPEGACMIRREAYEEAGGCFEPYFFSMTELDLTTRMIGLGWDVRYLPQAAFEHRREQTLFRIPPHDLMRIRIRNQLWYFWMRFPRGLAVRRVAGYLAFDLLESARRGTVRSWFEAIAEAWRERHRVRGHRRPLPRAALRRAELNRGRTHVRFLWEQLLRRLSGRRG